MTLKQTLALKPITFIVLLTTLLTGCMNNVMLSNDTAQAQFLDTNYMTFEHPFTEEAEANVKTRAERLCNYEKQLAVRTERACTMDKCVTHYQCVSSQDATEYGLNH